MVAEVEGQRFCVLVDELIGKQEVVIKTLGETFKNVTGVAGGAILGDGRVGLILDLDRISQGEGLVTRRAGCAPRRTRCGRWHPRSSSRFRQLAYRTFGLDLKSGKEELVSARLRKLVRGGGFHSFQEYYRSIVQDRTGESLLAMIDALATNHTSFLREPDHFQFLRDQVIPALGTRDPVEIWSAACSTGEEVWTLAMVLNEALPAAACPHHRQRHFQQGAALCAARRLPRGTLSRSLRRLARPLFFRRGTAAGELPDHAGPCGRRRRSAASTWSKRTPGRISSR